VVITTIIREEMFDFGVEANLSKNIRKNEMIQQREKLCNTKGEGTCHIIPNPTHVNEVDENDTYICS